MKCLLATLLCSLKELDELIYEYDKSIGNDQVLTDDHKLIAQDMMKFLKIAEQSAEKSTGFIKGIKAQTININTSNSQVFNVKNVISDALSVLDFALKNANCQLITDYDDSISLYGDRKLYVITNLVINSIDAQT